MRQSVGGFIQEPHIPTNNDRLTVSLAAIRMVISWSRMSPTSATIDQFCKPLLRELNVLTVILPRKVLQESTLVGLDLLTHLYHIPLVFQCTLNDRIHELLDGIPKGLRRIAEQLGQRPKCPKRVPLEHDILNLSKRFDKRTESPIRFAKG